VLTPLLSTKLYIPPARPNRVPRPRLIEQLSISKPLTLIAAPAGFGKTTLLSDWIPQSRHCVTWLSLDEDDNDPIRFWVYVVATLQKLRANLGEGALVLLRSPQPPPVAAILSTLINDISSFPDKFSIVLDDYHLIKTQSIHEALTFLLEHLPPQVHMILTTRADPPLPVSRLRARNQLTELRADDLRFTLNEGAVFLNDVMGLRLSVDDIATLETRTEGWIAGLQLAALSMQGHDDVSGFIQAFSGSHRHVLTYLAEEVLEQRPEGTLSFLLQTSILDRLCGSLCDAVTEQHDGQETLEKLEQANLFIVSLDNEGKWYRYHHLFAEVLRARLQQTQPGLILELHHRASTWYEQNRLIAEAINHAMAATDLDKAARLVEQSAWHLIGRGELTTLQTWLDHFPPDVVSARPRLSLAYAMIRSITNQLDALESHLQDAERVLENETIRGEDSLFDDRDALKGQVAALRAHLALEQDDPQRSIELCTQALVLIPEENALLHSLTMYFLGNAQSATDDITGGIQTLNKGSQRAVAAGNPLLVLNILAVKADLERAQGKLRQAAATYQQSIKLAIEKGWQLHPHAVVAHIGFGELFRERNDLDSAAQYLQESLELGQRWGLKNIEIRACLALASVRLAQQDPANAHSLIQQAVQVATDWNRTTATRFVEHHEARLALEQGAVDIAARWADTSGLEVDNVRLPYEREDEYLSLARVWIAQERTEEALRLLNRLLQAAENSVRMGSAIEILILHALALQMQNNGTEAITAVERALTLAEPEGYVRIFVDKGESMREVIGNWRHLHSPAPAPGDVRQVQVLETGRRINITTIPTRLVAYADKLLEAFPNTAPQLATPYEKVNSPILQASLIDPLSARELEVLHLIAEGLSNDAVAQKLFLSTGTVKVHLKHIYGKLDVNSRTQAVARLRELSL
jgi:LuxR family transcriptional regulator, maltose regulon positive regulatory protein